MSVARKPLLEVRGLTVGFARADAGQFAAAVDDVSFSLPRGKTLCIVGESGCGKSVTALSILRLLPSPPARLLGGSVFFDGEDLAAMPEKALRRIRGNRVGMIFQDPMTSLNPVIRVGRQIAESLRLHRGLGRKEAEEVAAGLLDKVGISDAAARALDFPHQMSGGMRQRVMIAMALACGPDLLIADEPTTALDVTVQRQVLDRMRDLIRDTGSSLLLITHDLGVVADIADEVAVMYAGRIVEQGPARALLTAPAHPYTLGLLRSRPGCAAPRQPLQAIPGLVPGLWDRPSGCAFHPRCPDAFSRCPHELPPFFPVGTENGGAAGPRFSRCWLRETGA